LARGGETASRGHVRIACVKARRSRTSPPVACGGTPQGIVGSQIKKGVLGRPSEIALTRCSDYEADVELEAEVDEDFSAPVEELSVLDSFLVSEEDFAPLSLLAAVLSLPLRA
ncbi:MAG: hypothetical protein ACM3TN_21700, partial [Alphaproteobacteria bacterium]